MSELQRGTVVLGRPAALEGGGRPPASPEVGWLVSYGTVQAVPFTAAAAAHPVAEAAYRAFEFATAAVLLLALSPLMLVEAVLIRLDSPGPAIFVQYRVGQSATVRPKDIAGREEYRAPQGGYDPGGLYLVPQTFRFLKFRTMFADAKERFPDLYSYTYEPGQFRRVPFKTDVDPRVTQLGMFLRQLTLDELPNLWCVLAGTMRLVGPRPEMPDLLKYYSAAEMQKFSVKPGITGLAQINGRGLLTLGETLDWDLAYVRTRTIWLDIKILVLTAWYVIVRRGAF